MLELLGGGGGGGVTVTGNWLSVEKGRLGILGFRYTREGKLYRGALAKFNTVRNEIKNNNNNNNNNKQTTQASRMLSPRLAITNGDRDNGRIWLLLYDWDLSVSGAVGSTPAIGCRAGLVSVL